ncbi:MAG: EAL domain-containing protein [Nitrosomonas sp.]
MLAFFVLAAFIPIFLLAYLSYWESTQLLIKEAHTRLEATSDVYKKSIYERLLLSDQLLFDLIQRSSKQQWPIDAKQQLNHRFKSLTVLAADGSLTPVFGNPTKLPAISPVARKHLSSNQPLLLTQYDGGEIYIFMLYARDHLFPEKEVVIAEMDTEFLWGSSDVFVMNMNLCVYNENSLKIFCTQPTPYPPTNTIQENTRSVKGDFVWRLKQNNYLANYQEIFLQAKFLTPRWLVVASQLETEAVESLKKFNTIFWGSVFFTILLIILLSMIQIRRVLTPLEKLIEGTRRLGRRDFSSKVPITSDDEFSELAHSFNTMSEKLGRQFQILATLSKIDREILSSLSIHKIIDDVLVHLQKITPINAISIAIFSENPDNFIEVYEINANGKTLAPQQKMLPNEIKQFLAQSPKGSYLTKKCLSVGETFQITDPKQAEEFLLPLIWKDQMVGYILLSLSSEQEWDDENNDFVQDYADRIAVALFTKNRELKLIKQARIDALTGMPNRLLFTEQLQKEIAQAEFSRQKLAVLYINLDQFKKVNEIFGHSIGDQLLCEAAQRIQSNVGETNTIARLGGDEFAIIIPQLNSTHQASDLATNLIHRLSNPFVIQNEENIVAASIGIAVYPNDGTSVAELMRNSGIAMDRAKQKNGNQYIFFEERMNAEVVNRNTIERELRRAISEREFILHYQPQIDPETNAIRGVEALVRWNHPEKGLLSPGYFIGIAEEVGFIVEIGQIVLFEACSQYRIWRNEGFLIDYVAVNVSVKQFVQENFLHQVKEALSKNAIPPHCLELEITESVLMDDSQVVLEVLRKLQDLGVQLSIDDFGTGYSSMSYLEQLPFNTLKIDQSFVRKIDNNGNGGIIAGTIAAMAHALGKKIVAEGVETQAQVAFLRNHHCELLQGYFYSKPLPAQELAKLILHKKILGSAERMEVNNLIE